MELNISTLKKCITALISGFLLTSCTAIKPWERDILAMPDMSYTPRELNFAFRQHVYQSREDTGGGYGAGGGGCGCN